MKIFELLEMKTIKFKLKPWKLLAWLFHLQACCCIGQPKFAVSWIEMKIKEQRSKKGRRRGTRSKDTRRVLGIYVFILFNIHVVYWISGRQSKFPDISGRNFKSFGVKKKVAKNRLKSSLLIILVLFLLRERKLPWFFNISEKFEKFLYFSPKAKPKGKLSNFGPA